MKEMDKIKSFFKNEYEALKSSVTKIEYLSWWILRLAMIIALIYHFAVDSGFLTKLLLALNLLATFTLTLARIILVPKKIIKKLPFRCQTWLNVIIFFGSFLSQGLNLNHTITNYDKFLHLLTGIFIVFMGNELTEMFMRKGDKVSPLYRTFSSVGFSFIAIVIWEIFEFFVDYYWPESSNQAYNTKPNPDMLFFKIFGQGAGNENQFAVFDTNIDMLCAVIGSVVSSVILLIYLYRKEKTSSIGIKQK